MKTMVDELDVRLLELLRESPRIGVLEMSRRLNVARGTVQARLDRLEGRGVLTGCGPDIDLREVGLGVQAFVTVEAAQKEIIAIAKAMEQIPAVLEVHCLAGRGDLLVRVAAPTTEALQDVVLGFGEIEGISRTSTAVVFSTPVTYRALPAVRATLHRLPDDSR